MVKTQTKSHSVWSKNEFGVCFEWCRRKCVYSHTPFSFSSSSAVSLRMPKRRKKMKIYTFCFILGIIFSVYGVFVFISHLAAAKVHAVTQSANELGVLVTFPILWILKMNAKIETPSNLLSSLKKRESSFFSALNFFLLLFYLIYFCVFFFFAIWWMCALVTTWAIIIIIITMRHYWPTKIKQTMCIYMTEKLAVIERKRKQKGKEKITRQIQSFCLINTVYWTTSIINFLALDIQREKKKPTIRWQRKWMNEFNEFLKEKESDRTRGSIESVDNNEQHFLSYTTKKIVIYFDIMETIFILLQLALL